MKRKTYVIGHRNPDTDSIVSAVAYAELKRQQGIERCFPARAGKLTPQTEYILKRFNVPVPEYIPDLVPKVSYFLAKEPVTVEAGTSLWNALDIMERENLKILPIVDAAGRYKSVLNYNAFASNITRKINPHRKAIIPTSIPLLLTTLNAQPIVVYGGNEVVKSRILVAGSSFDSFKQQLESEIPANALVLTGDREDIQRFSIESGVRAVVITNGISLAKGLRELAEKHQVTVMISPYDTSSTSFLILYSTPVVTMADSQTEAVSANSYVRSIREKLNESPSRSLAVVDDNRVVVGVFTESDLIKEPNIDIIMVDHNELSQAVEGMESYRILEIIDHHRLGNFSTKHPITFINRVVGATATIVAGMYVEQRAVLKPEIAGVLLAGILADTLILRSATTTNVDREMAEYLAGLVDLDVERFGQEIFDSSSNLKHLTIEEILGRDSKVYTACGKKFKISQVEVNAGVDTWDGSKGVLAALHQHCQQSGLYFAALMVTDIVALNSQLLIYGEDEFLRKIAFPRLEKNLYVCRDILSRKKQLVPLLIEQMESVLGVRDQHK
ncbi:MAG: putative manganese-dependent inorganic diphosphatase [Kiritimatiellae bacterium]|nr:putative manganese-dependent inorganic diphosphatase [Kiritimatiellia bacterium]